MSVLAVERPRRTREYRIDRDLVFALYDSFGKMTHVKRALAEQGIHCAYNTVRNILNGKQDKRPGRKTQSRFAARPVHGRAVLPDIDTPAFTEKRTLYPHTVVKKIAAEPLLKHGQNSSKIGGLVLKGKWKGMPIYTLTLEERATCPTSCQHWRSCFGNKMQLAHRMNHLDPNFETQLVREVCSLGRKHPQGFVIRLHVLGDFFSVRYVQVWQALLEQVPGLRVFGYSARWQPEDPIAAALVRLVMAQWERFSIRFSNAPADECATVSIEHPIQRPPDAVICPEQVGKTESCSTCGLCWQTKRRIAFLQH
jgi:hypothetical protein